MPPWTTQKHPTPANSTNARCANSSGNCESATRKQPAQKRTKVTNPELEQPEPLPLRALGVRTHKCKGREVFARKDLRPREVLLRWEVEYTTNEVAEAADVHDSIIWTSDGRPLLDRRFNKNRMWYLFNHAWPPRDNCEIKMKSGKTKEITILEMRAKKHIKRGESCEFHYTRPDPNWPRD